ncbi:MAG: UDP-N-acetylmuramoyl-L-alanine--D-glutamate ligase [Clostridiales bacterium]|jgi:UDP-N-acetylmuramoylalanine--D-glutamate ligase|nr:UDP-N-acetylmuramoyl-L-alanine--D-glutamate ligase [Clostridiales bacterium]
MTYKDKKVLVCGMGLSGVAAARLLLAHGAAVTLCDLKEEPEVCADLLAHPLISTYFGKNPDEILGEFDLMVLSPGIATDLPFVTQARARGLPIFGEVELASRHCNAPIMGITGTNGKTTVCSLAGDIMRLAAPGSAVAGNIGVAFCGLAPEMPVGAWVVAEVSSFQLETIVDFRPKISAVLNMTPDHLNRHKTMEAYIAAKERIFENQENSDFCVLNYDNQHSRAMAAKTRAKVVFFSNSPLEEGVFVQNGAIWLKWQDFDGELIKLEDIPIPGSHNVENVMAAAALCAVAGAPPALIARGIREFKAVEHRLEFVAEIAGVAYYNDSKATNVDSAIKGVTALNRPIVLIGGGQDKAADFGEFVKVFPGRVKAFIVLGETAEQLIETCRAHNFSDFERANTLKDAVELAAARAVAGDAVLLSPACAALDMFDNYEQRGWVFKNFVNELK